jgi:hypothetical protein
MNESDPDYLSDFLENSVYEGVWEAFYEAPSNRVKWTLTNMNAVILFAFFTTILAMTQAQLWIILRFLIHRLFPSAQLSREPNDPVSVHPDLKLTQGEALYDLTFLVKEASVSLCKMKRPRLDFPRSLWFAVAAGLNTGVFVIMGLAIPYFISEGTFSAPVVRSALTKYCKESPGVNGSLPTINVILKTVSKVDAIYKQCLGTTLVGCDVGYYLQEAAIETRRLDSCPFSPEVCFDGVRPLEITHHNITAFEVGVNSKYPLSIGHRATCSPIRTEPLIMYPTSEEVEWSFLTITDKLYLKKIVNDTNALRNQLENFAMKLRTRNGPNTIYPNERSGLKVIQKGYPADMSILPRMEGYSGAYEHPVFLSPVLRTTNSTVGRLFVVIYRAGVVGYTKQMTDPFFSAHFSRAQAEEAWPNDVETKGVLYIPDFEATAMACIEQYKFCLRSSGICTDWDSDPYQIFLLLPYVDDLFEFGELALLFGRMLQNAWLSLYYFLSTRTEWFGMLPLRNPYRVDRMVLPDDTNEMWVQEVETWFRKSILQAILILRTGARFNMVNFTNHESFKDANGFCSRILFRDGNYININWIGFWVTVSTMALIWAGSILLTWRVELFRGLVCAWKRILAVGRTIWRVLTFCGQALSHGFEWVRIQANLFFREVHGLWSLGTMETPRQVLRYGQQESGSLELRDRSSTSFDPYHNEQDVAGYEEIDAPI